MTREFGTVTMYPKLERREWIFTPPAEDPRNVRIAQLEEVMRGIAKLCAGSRNEDTGRLREYLAVIARVAEIALLPAPERDMAVTVEEFDA